MPKYINKRLKIRDLNMDAKKALSYGWTPYEVPDANDDGQMMKREEKVEAPVLGTAKEEAKIEPIGTSNDEVVVAEKPTPKKTRKPRKKKVD